MELFTRRKKHPEVFSKGASQSTKELIFPYFSLSLELRTSVIRHKKRKYHMEPGEVATVPSLESPRSGCAASSSPPPGAPGTASCGRIVRRSRSPYRRFLPRNAPPVATR